MKEIIQLLFKIANVDEREIFWLSDDCKELRSNVVNLDISHIPFFLLASFDSGRMYRKSEIVKHFVDYLEAATC